MTVHKWQSRGSAARQEFSDAALWLLLGTCLAPALVSGCQKNPGIDGRTTTVQESSKASGPNQAMANARPQKTATAVARIYVKDMSERLHLY